MTSSSFFVSWADDSSEVNSSFPVNVRAQSGVPSAHLDPSTDLHLTDLDLLAHILLVDVDPVSSVLAGCGFSTATPPPYDPTDTDTSDGAESFPSPADLGTPAGLPSSHLDALADREQVGVYKVDHQNPHNTAETYVCRFCHCGGSLSRGDSLKRHRQKSCSYRTTTDGPSYHVFSVSEGIPFKY